MPPAVSDHQQAAPEPPSPSRGGIILPQSPLRIKQDGKFYERLLTKESSGTGNLSFRYYWAEPGSVPFVWETQPGTPRDVAATAAGAVPAITPPPSYLLRRGTNNKVVAGASHQHQQSKKKGCRVRRIRVGFIAGIFRRLSLMKTWRRAEPPPVKVSSSSRWLFSSSVATERGKHADHHRTVTCGSFRFRARPSPWLPRFRSAGNGGRA
jgi:hypothetical protein